MNTNYSNFNGYETYIEAEANYQKFTSNLQGIMDTGEKTNVITNIDIMHRRFDRIVSNGTLDTNDWRYKEIDGIITDARKYLSLEKPSVEDIIFHYSCFRNFSDLITPLEGGGKNV